MCGIAGYNVSTQWCNEHCGTDKIMEDIIQEGWFHNIHRGYDSAGLFAVSPENKTMIFKKPGIATEIFKDEIKETGLIGPAKVLALHTRAPSTGSGDPKDNENNHPVGWGGVWTTHNGTLYNDPELKRLYSGGKPSPIVDSVALSMVLAQTEPTDFSSVLQALEEVTGNFSIHSIWENHPGISLLARSAASNPLIMAVHKNENAVVYGSEKESVWHVIYMMGLDGGDPAWNWVSLDAGNAVLIDEGKPVAWGNFRPSGWFAGKGNQTPYIMSRWLPKEKDRSRTFVYSTSDEHDYVNKARNPKFYDTDKGKLLYTRVGGFTDEAEDEGFPYDKGEMDWGAVFCEADEIRADGDFIHIMYGSVEIVATKSGRIVRDVMNHDLFTMGKRWSKVKRTEQQAALEPSDLEWEDFIRIKGTHVGQLPTQLENYEYIRIMNNDAQVYNGGWDRWPFTDEPAAPVVQDPLTKMTPAITLDWNNFYDVIVRHKDMPDMIFLNDGNCPTHNEKFSQHNIPLGCPLLLNAATYTMAAFEDVSLFLFTDEYSVKYEMNDVEDFCDSIKGKECDWRIVEITDVWTPTAYWEIVSGEQCLICGVTRLVDRYPDWFELVNSLRRGVGKSVA